MKNGHYKIFCVQARITEKSPHGKPNGPLQPVDDNWGVWTNDLFDSAGKGNDWHHIPKDSYDNFGDVQQQMGFDYHGWTKMKFAIQAMKRVKKNDANGKYDYTENGMYDGKKNTAVRHEFRIVRLTIAYSIIPVTMDEMIEELV